MKNHRLPFAFVATMIVWGCATEGFSSTGKLEWTIVSLYVKPQPTVAGTVTVGCAWTAYSNYDWKFSDEFMIVPEIEVSDVATGGDVDYGYWGDQGKTYPPNGKQYTSGPTSDFDGVMEHTMHLSAGLHKVVCRLVNPLDLEDFDYQKVTFDVKVPKVSISDQPPGAGNVMAVTPQVPPTPPSRRKEPLRQAQAVLPPAGKPHRFRAGEKLVLVDGRSLTIQNARLVLLDGKGNVLRTFPRGVMVMVESDAEVSIQRGPLNVPLGTAKR